MAEVVVHGLRELRSRLDGLPVKIERKVFRQALRATANKIKPRLIAATPALSGAAKKSVKVTVRVRRRGAYAAVKYTKRPAMYMRIFEHGSKRQAARPYFGQAVSGFDRDAIADFTDALKAAVERNEG